MPGRVHSRRQFERLARPLTKGRSGPLRVHFTSAIEPSESFSVAYAIGRNVGGAVERNRIRRRLRAAMDELRPGLRSGLYLIKCDIAVKELTYEQLHHHLTEALRHADARD